MDGERIGLFFYFGLDLGFGFDLRLALDSLRARRIRACRFVFRTTGPSLAVGATGAPQAAVFHISVRAGVASRATTFQLAVGAGVQSAQ